MKRLFVLLALLLAVFVFAGCSQSESTPEKPTENQSVVQETQQQTEETEALTQAPTEKTTQAPTQAPTQKPTKAPTKKPTQAPQKDNVGSLAGLYVSDEAYYTMADANYVQLNENGTAVMQINLLEAVAYASGTYSVSGDGIVTLGEMVGPAGNVIVRSGSQLHKYADGIMLVYGVQDRFAVQGWNAPPAFRDGSFFRSLD